MSNPRSAHVADRLLAAIDRVGSPVCVGLDPVIARLPASLRPAAPGPAAEIDAIARFGEGVIDSVAEHVPCVKLQSACFERYRGPGLTVLDELVARAVDRGLEVIVDAKRGDIGLSAEHYAAGTFGGACPADWITINGYLGPDSVDPFLATGGGVFVLVRTSNPDGDVLQGQPLLGGGTVAEAVAGMVAGLGDGRIGEQGYSAVGAVVGATRPDAAATLRRVMPRQILLVPGFGAQGGGVDDVLPCFNADGRGALITASRSVIYPAEGGIWADAVARAAERFASSLRQGLGV